MPQTTTIGLHLAGTRADVAMLIALVDACPEVQQAPCQALDHPDRAETVLTWPDLDPRRLVTLWQRGLPLVEVALRGATVRLTVPGSQEPPAAWSPVIRPAHDLVQAVRPVRVAGEPLAGQAVFCMARRGAGAAPLLRRLMLLGRDEVEVCQWEDGRGGELWVVAAPPPLYLLMRARDELPRDVVAYARFGDSDLWVEWGYEHPLAERAAAAVMQSEQSALVDRRGRWRRVPRPWPMHSVYDAITTKFDAGVEELVPADGPVPRFTIELRLAPGQARDPELWLLSADEFLSLESFVEAASPADLKRITAARLTDLEGTVWYVLRERLRPGDARAAATAGLGSYLGHSGHALAEGTDNLYLPADARLIPRVRRDELREIFGLGDADTVIVREDQDGPQIVSVSELQEEPLSRWVDLVATDNRLELDRLLEATIFTLPEVVSDEPPKKRKTAPPPRAKRKTIPPRRRPRQRPLEPTEEGQPQAPGDNRALRARAAELEVQISDGGCRDPLIWHELGGILGHLQQWDDVPACIEAACFHAGDDDRVIYARDLEQHLARSAGVKRTDDVLTEAVLAAEQSPGALAFLGAVVLRRILDGQPVPDEIVQLALPVFADPRRPISRRHAWSVLHAWYRHTDDRIGLTRAREALLGGINEHGLSVLHDLPLFVRYRLALEDEDTPLDSDQPRARQIAQLETLWEVAERRGLPALDAHSNYVRLIFAVGFMRLGARATARRITAAIPDEIDTHEGPNRTLFRLYLARMAHVGTEGGEESWATEAESILDKAVGKARALKAARWLAAHSAWLATEQEKGEPGRRLQSKLERRISALEVQLSPETALGTSLDELSAHMKYDYELSVAIERFVNMALRTGREQTLAATMEAATGHLSRITIIGQRCRAIGACVRLASALGDASRVESLMDELVRIAVSRSLTTAGDLARAAIPAVAALRRFGDEVSGQRLLEALESVEPYLALVKVQLRAVVAQGYQLLRRPQRADALMDQALDSVLHDRLDHVSRFQAGKAVAQALRHWPNHERVPRCVLLLTELDTFHDTFTTRGWFATHEVLMLEQLVDTVADSETRQSDRIQRFLDLEEHAIRQRMTSDWSTLCGP